MIKLYQTHAVFPISIYFVRCTCSYKLMPQLLLMDHRTTIWSELGKYTLAIAP